MAGFEIVAAVRAGLGQFEKDLKRAGDMARIAGTDIYKATSVKPNIDGIRDANKRLSEMQAQAKTTRDRLSEMLQAGADAKAVAPLRRELNAVSAQIRQLKTDTQIATAEMNANDPAARFRQGAARFGVGVGTAAVAVGGAAFAGVKQLADQAEQMENLRASTGLTINQLGELRFLADENGWSFESMTRATGMLTRQLAGMEEGSGRAGEAAARLGIQLRDQDGALRPMSELFPQIVNALRGVGNETERAQLASALLGRSYQELMPYIAASSAELDTQVKVAKEANAVYNEQMHLLGLSADAILDNLSTTLAGLRNTFVTTFGPLLLGIVRAVDNIAKSISGVARLVGVGSPMTNGVLAFVTAFSTALAVIHKLIPVLRTLRTIQLSTAAITAALTGNWKALLVAAGVGVGVAIAAHRMTVSENEEMARESQRAAAKAAKAGAPGVSEDVAARIFQAAAAPIGAMPTPAAPPQLAAAPAVIQQAALGGAAMGGSADTLRLLGMVEQIRDTVVRIGSMQRTAMGVGSLGVMG